MKYKHYILVALNVLIGGSILFFLIVFGPFAFSVVFSFIPFSRGMAVLASLLPVTVVASLLILIIAVIRKSRGQMTNNNPENQPAFKALPTATVFAFFALLPVLVCLLSLPAQGIVHDYRWGLGWFNDHAHPVSFFNSGTVWLASAAIFLIAALTLVIYTIKLGVTKRISRVWIIVTVIVTGTAIVAGVLLLIFELWLGASGGE